MSGAAAFGRRQALFGLAGAATLSFAGVASAQAQDAPSATAPVQSLSAALLKVMQAGDATPFATRYAILEPAVGRAFDLNAILRVSVGAAWNSMPPVQQAALSTSFRRYTVANFVANFDNYDGQTIAVSPDTRSLPDGDQVVDTRISGSGTPVELSYVMRRTAGGWRAVDVLAQGSISRVATQRSDFRTVLSTGGGDALVSSLEGKVTALSGGTLA